MTDIEKKYDKNVLVIDDEEDIIELIVYNLKKYKINIDVAYNGKDALRLLKENKYDLVSTDIAMPEIDGIYVMEKMRNDGLAPDTPIIVISAFLDNGVMDELKDFNIDFAFSKPLDRKKFHSFLENKFDKI